MPYLTKAQRLDMQELLRRKHTRAKVDELLQRLCDDPDKERANTVAWLRSYVQKQHDEIEKLHTIVRLLSTDTTPVD